MPPPRMPRGPIFQPGRVNTRTGEVGRGPKRISSKKETLLKKYGLLSKVVVKVPWWLICLECFVVHFSHFVLHVALVVAVVGEALGITGDSGATGFYFHEKQGVVAKAEASDKAAALRLLASVVYDGFFGLLQASHMATWAIGLPSFSENAASAIRRLAVLQSTLASAFYFSAVLRWRRRSMSYVTPPLFLLLAYGVLPWIDLSVWFLLLRTGDHLLGGDIAADLGVMAAVFLCRACFFGEHGLPRKPRKERDMGSRIGDWFVLACFALVLDYVVLRSGWWERRKNWKYVFCLINMLWPLFVWKPILDFFRKQADVVPQSAQCRGASLERRTKKMSQSHSGKTGAPVAEGLRSRGRKRAPVDSSLNPDNRELWQDAHRDACFGFLGLRSDGTGCAPLRAKHGAFKKARRALWHERSQTTWLFGLTLPQLPTERSRWCSRSRNSRIRTSQSLGTSPLASG